MHLSTQTLTQWIATNKYPVGEDRRNEARCIDGRYPKSTVSPAPLTIPGADIGQMAILVSAAQTYGFEVDIDRALAVLGTIGRDLQDAITHLDRTYCAGCGHVQLMKKYPTTYHVDPAQLEAVLARFTDQPPQAHVNTTAHPESAVVVIRGSLKWSVYSQDQTMCAYVVHKALVDARHVLLSRALIAEGAVSVEAPIIMFEPETLYEYLSSVYDEHLMATLAYVAAGLPFYFVTMNDDGSCVVESRDKVEGFVGGGS